MKKRYSLTLDVGLVEEVRKQIPRGGLSDFVERLLEFWLLNSGMWSTYDDGITRNGEDYEFLARIHKGSVKIPPVGQFKNGDIVRVVITTMGEEEKEE